MTALFYIFCFIFITVVPAYSYIDPGTGSMLFSVLIGGVSTVFFVFKSFLIKIRTLPIWHKTGSIDSLKNRKDFVFYSEGKQYWNIFKPIIDEFINRKQLCYYYTSDEKDPGLEYQSEFLKSSFIGKGNKAYASLNMLEAEVCLMTTPGLDVYQLKRSPGVKHYSHILHAADDATFYRLFGLDYFDSVLLTGEYQKKAIRELEQKRGLKPKELIVVGCTYLDVLREKVKSLSIDNKKSDFTVLVSPSWGDNGILKKFGINLLKPLAETGFKIIIRPHPQSSISEKSVLDSLTEKLAGYKNIEWDFSRENIASMSKADVMISDFSGIIFDYFFLFSKPVIYTKYEFDKRAYDVSDVDEEPWKFRILREIGYELSEENFAHVSEILKQCINNQDLVNKINDAKNTAYFYEGQSGVKCTDALFAIKKKLNK